MERRAVLLIHKQGSYPYVRLKWQRIPLIPNMMITRIRSPLYKAFSCVGLVRREHAPHFWLEEFGLRENMPAY
jgi:hypothetical protein